MARFSIKDVLGVYFSLKGRIGRGDFWAYGVALTVFTLLVMAVGQLASSMAGAIIQMTAIVLMLWAYMGLLVKRGHDRGRPAVFSIGVLLLRVIANSVGEASSLSMWALAVEVVLGVYVFIDYALIAGKGGSNRYGPSPSGPGVTKPLVLGPGDAPESSALPTSPPNA
ncbi:DUF805 domain-containing protein [Caulobacter sp.]|uniref:DUF805 domain-containing protein n=1 Tax=Caulobacter sp. TaxID=78 RepID=UPI003BAAA059